MPASDDIRDGLGEAFDTLSAEFLSGVTITLCKASSTADSFTDLLAVTEKRFFEYSNFRQNFLLEIADESTNLTNAIAAATHVKVNSDYYVIRTGDTTAPNSTDATWKLYCDQHLERRSNWRQL